MFSFRRKQADGKGCYQIYGLMEVPFGRATFYNASPTVAEYDSLDAAGEVHHIPAASRGISALPNFEKGTSLARAIQYTSACCAA